MGSTCLSLRLSRLFVFLFFFFFFFSHRNIVWAKLILRPSDTESMVGSLAFLNCSTDNLAEEIFWYHYAVGSADRRIIYGYKKIYEERFHLEKMEAAGAVAFNLVIPVVSDKDAGIFECQDGAGQGERSPQVQMVVLGAAVCETDIRRSDGVIGPNSCGLTPDDIQLTCRVKFLGNQPPIIAWFRDDSNQPITDGVSQRQSNDYVIHNVTIAVDSSIDGRSFECRPTRSPPSTAQRLCATEAVTVAESNSVVSSTKFAAVVTCLAIALPFAFLTGFVVHRFIVKRRKRKKRSDEATAEDALPLIESDTRDIAKRREEESKRIKDELDRYENIIYRKGEAKYYKEKPIFAHEIKTKQRSSLISGITLLHHRLYVVHENCSSIEVYDSKTFTLESSLKVKNLENPLDIASSESSGCLYVADKPEIQPETKNPEKEKIQMPLEQSKVNEEDFDFVEISSNEDSLPHDDKRDKLKKTVQEKKEDEFRGKENSPKIFEKDPTKNNNDQSSGKRTTDGAPIDTTDHLSGEHQTGSNKDNETPEGYQQEHSAYDEEKKLSETTQLKDDINERALKEVDNKHAKKSDKKDLSSVDDETNQGKDQVSAEVEKDQTVDGRTDEPQRDANSNPLKTRKVREAEECRILALDARGSIQNKSPWSVDDVECRLSVVYSSSNVIVCLLNKRQIIEFSSSGEELRKIRLSPGDGFHRLFHAIRVSHSYFAVSYCKAPPRSDDDHRLSIIDDKGKVRFTSNDLNSFKRVSKNERMNMASYLIVDCNKSILMSDAINCRVLVFDATLKTPTDLIPKDGVLSSGLKNQPTRITLDEENGRLFIALKQKDEKMSENKGVSVFQVA